MQCGPPINLGLRPMLYSIRQGVNFTNTLRVTFLLESFAQSFFVVYILVLNFFGSRLLAQMRSFNVGEIDHCSSVLYRLADKYRMRRHSQLMLRKIRHFCPYPHIVALYYSDVVTVVTKSSIPPSENVASFIDNHYGHTSQK